MGCPFRAWMDTDGDYRGRCPRLGLMAPVRRPDSLSQFVSKPWNLLRPMTYLKGATSAAPGLPFILPGRSPWKLT